MLRALPLLLSLLACACESEPYWFLDSAEPRERTLEFELHPELVTAIEATWRLEYDADRCWLRYEWYGQDELSTTAMDCPAGEHSQLVIGLPENTQIILQLVLERDGVEYPGVRHIYDTDHLPEPLLEPRLGSWAVDQTAGHWILGAIEQGHPDAGEPYYDGPYWQFIMNRRGEVVWYRQLPDGLSSTFPRIAHSGDHIVAERVDRFGLAGNPTPVIERIAFDLTVLSELEVPGLRFAWDEADDGSIYYFDREDDGEGWLSRLSPEGSRERLFDCVDWIADRCDGPHCCEFNAVVVEPERGSVLMSLWATDTVLEVDLESLTVRHSWGQLEGSWSTQPDSAGFDLQHYPSFTPDGTLLVGTHVPDLMQQHRIREYTVDEDAEQLTEIWSWGEGQELFAQYQGEAQRFDSGNTLMNFGSAGAMREVAPDGELLWVIDWQEPWLLGHTTVFDDLWALLPED